MAYVDYSFDFFLSILWVFTYCSLHFLLWSAAYPIRATDSCRGSITRGKCARISMSSRPLSISVVSHSIAILRSLSNFAYKLQENGSDCGRIVVVPPDWLIEVLTERSEDGGREGDGWSVSRFALISSVSDWREIRKSEESIPQWRWMEGRCEWVSTSPLHWVVVCLRTDSPRSRGGDEGVWECRRGVRWGEGTALTMCTDWPGPGAVTGLIAGVDVWLFLDMFR